MNRIALILAFSIALAGCSQVTTGVTNARNWLADPKTTAAVQTLKAGAMAFVCTVQGNIALAANIEAAVNAGQALQRDTHTALVVSTLVCDALGGNVTGTAVVPAS